MMPMFFSTHSGEEFVEGALVEQAVASGEEEAVEIAFAGKAGQHFPLVHARTDGLDDALAAQLVERGVSTVDGSCQWLSGS